MKRNSKLTLLLILLTISVAGIGQSAFIHPRGLIHANELDSVRQKIKQEPFLSMMKALRNNVIVFEARQNKTLTDSTEFAREAAYMYALSGEQSFADKAWKYTEGILRNRDILDNPVSRGLNRAAVLRNMAEVYDFCFNGWNKEQNQALSNKLFYLIMTTSSNMGYDANYAMESNWMGIRYSAVLLASIVNDDWQATEKDRSRLLPFEWNAINRLREHIAVNINSNGWNTESVSYFAYNWSFVGPALVALENKLGESRFSIESNLPNAVNALWGYSTATVAIPGLNSRVMQPDFADDDPMSSYYLLPLGLRLFPAQQKPALLWMLRYLSGPDTWPTDGEQLFYNILWTPLNMKPVNPSTEGWLTYYDSDQGLALFRNQFKDENDIVAGFTATARRVRGHQGNDNLGFRILGLGSIWVVGAGRTDQVGGQSTLFPVSDIAHLTAQKGALGKVLATHFDEDGSGAISASGSCMGVLNHQRSLQVDYSRESGAAAVFIINDHSDNGRVWRMNSPIFNDLRINHDGFSLVSPQGAELRATVFTDIPQLNISSVKLRYGGATTRLNRGIEYRGKSYDFTHAIDCKTNGNICVVLTLQPKGKAQPVVQRVAANKIMVGSKLYVVR